MNEIKRWDFDASIDAMDEFDDGEYVLCSDHEAEVARLRAEVQGLRDGLEAIYQFGSDTLSGPTGDTPDDRQWHRTAVLEMTNRASRTADTGSWKKNEVSSIGEGK